MKFRYIIEFKLFPTKKAFINRDGAVVAYNYELRHISGIITLNQNEFKVINYFFDNEVDGKMTISTKDIANATLLYKWEIRTAINDLLEKKVFVRVEDGD